MKIWLLINLPNNSVGLIATTIGAERTVFISSTYTCTQWLQRLATTSEPLIWHRTGQQSHRWHAWGQSARYCGPYCWTPTVQPSVVVTLSKLFQLIMLCDRIPSGFHKSYVVPIPKIKDKHTKALTCDDFRGIAISPVISKVFEYCIVDRFSKCLSIIW